MKQAIVIVAPLVLSACGGSSTWTGADPSSGPTHVGGSADHTTTAFDGEYRDLSVQNNSKGNSLPSEGGTGARKCANYSGNEFPPLTVTKCSRTVRSNGYTLRRICDAARPFEDE